MDNLNRLTELFRQFPGIGPRQAKRFVYFLLHSNSAYRAMLVREIADLAARVAACTSCHRFFDRKNADAEDADEPLCLICRDSSRDSSSLMVVAKDVDLEAVEKSKVYNGYYFILGNTLSLIEKDPESRVRAKELLETVSDRGQKGLKEIILALSLNSEGEHTREYVEELISPLAKKHGIKISVLGRGLSTGTELEYSDAETIRNALIGRKQEIF